jgi:uncharacterized membrane protein
MAQDQLTPARLQAFSDGVIAVIITVMVLELKVPGKEVGNVEGLHTILPLLLVYLLSFVQTGIYWVNHHYLLDDLQQVSHGILWSNLALLFSLSLIPVATDWVARARHLALLGRAVQRGMRISRHLLDVALYAHLPPQR